MGLPDYRQQGGFGLIEAAIYAGIAIAVLGAIAGVIYAWNSYTEGLDKRGYDRGTAEIRAELQPKLIACEGEITKQNSAIEAMRQEGLSKQARAASALRKAEVKAKVWDADAKRLRAVLASRKPTDPQDCKAAWTEIRRP